MQYAHISHLMHAYVCTHAHTHAHTHTAPPGPTSVSVAPGLNTLVVMVTSPSYGGSPAYYNVSLMGTGSARSVVTLSPNTTFDGLPSNTPIFITVVAINCAGSNSTYINTGTCKCTNMVRCHGITSSPSPSSVPPPYKHQGAAVTTGYDHPTDHHMDTCGMILYGCT